MLCARAALVAVLCTTCLATLSPTLPAPGAYCTAGSPQQCNATNLCPPVAPYQCNHQNRSATPSCDTVPFTPVSCNGECFDARTCEVEKCPPCDTNSAGCNNCTQGSWYFCSEGTLEGHCFESAAEVTNTTTCTNCCYARACHVCPPCTMAQCDKYPCPGSTEVCLTNGGCASGHVWPTPECPECCALSSCPTPPPRPANPWDAVPLPVNCNATGLPDLSPSPAATPYGGVDVSQHGCRAWVTSDSCCGYVPRFNWILSTCHQNISKRNTQACTHVGANFTRFNINYVAVYQWDGTGWNRDDTSSVEYGANMTEYYLGGGWPNDWDLKYGPTTAFTGTNGVGPPAMMFVLSADAFAWSAFYALNQITVNRGPGGEVVADNCWSSSSGEFDFVESPFWAGVTIPTDRLYFTTTADSGRCLPTAKSAPSRYSSECSSNQCCLQCSCDLGSDAPVCFGETDNIGYTPMGCIQLNGTVPNGSMVFTVDGSNVSCANFTGAVGGGADSSSYFKQPNEYGDEPAVFAAVIDADGTTVYRWPADDLSIWPGITRFYAASRLDAVTGATRPTKVTFETPCVDPTKACGITHPSCAGDCPLIEAGGVFGEYTAGGAYCVEAAKDKQNWWDLFVSTGQLDGRMAADKLPFYAPVPHFTPPLPFYCNGSCGALCVNESCSVNSTYMCTSGDGYMGCTTDAITWPTSGRCGSCCNTTSCYFECPVCSEAEEAQFCGSCPSTAPYACTAGPAAGGCQPTNGWGQNPRACHSCCVCQGASNSPPATTATPPPFTLLSRAVYASSRSGSSLAAVFGMCAVLVAVAMAVKQRIEARRAAAAGSRNDKTVQLP
jgi:hypothetical protein